MARRLCCCGFRPLLFLVVHQPPAKAAFVQKIKDLYSFDAFQFRPRRG